MTELRDVLESYDLHLSCLQRFFREFSDKLADEGTFGTKTYLNQLQRIANEESKTFDISADDLIQFFPPGEGDKAAGLVDGVLLNTKRYVALMYEAAEKVKNETTPTDTAKAIFSSNIAAAMEQAKVPINMRSAYEVHIHAPRNAPVYPVRDIRARHVGSLVNVSALVTRVTAVKPRIVIAAYRCNDCGTTVFQAVETSSYMPLSQCNAGSCVRNKARGELQLLIRESKFVKYQEVTVQEPSHHVPQGCIPRSLKIVVEGEMTRQLTPGTSATLSGIFLPVVKSGFAAIRAGLVAETYFEVHHIDVHKKGYAEELKLLPEEMDRILSEWNDCPDLYEKLSQSIAPAICGLEDVKKAILLQLVGGVTETFNDSMKIRGDIHILLMGDPGVAKSQLLRQICHIAPRSHYTTGKGTSGVGLTASVIKDPVTGEFTLEGGAIVLADNGVCCIDEFDKMDESDRTAIHEVMEQQTVSIAKAGISTTLNARTSILAAANPVFGRYDLTKSPVANMNLPTALLTRFDIQFLLLDKPDIDKDTDLAKHVLHVHRYGAAPNHSKSKYFDAKTMRMLIARARRFSPKLPPRLVSEIVEHYIDLRSREALERDGHMYRGCTTPRTLTAVLRMSQALARLRRSDMIERGDFEEAVRLMQASKDSVVIQSDEDDESLLKKGQRVSDFRTEIMEILKDIDTRFSRRNDWDGYLNLQRDVEIPVVAMGFNHAQLHTTLEEYEELEVIKWKDDDRSSLAFVERLDLVGDHDEFDELDEE